MKEDHISFAKLSDLYDNEFETVDEKENLLQHIEDCKNCSLQFSLLRSSVQLTEQLGKTTYLYRDFPLRTMEIIRLKRRKKMFFKAMPAIAASCLIIFGAAIYTSQNNTSNNPVANNSSQNNTEKIVSIISENKASIVQINDNFIEGEITIEEFRKLRRDLGFRKVLYKVVSSQNNINRGFSSNKWRSDIENVGLGTGYTPQTFDASEQVVRFRVLK